LQVTRVSERTRPGSVEVCTHGLTRGFWVAFLDRRQNAAVLRRGVIDIVVTTTQFLAEPM
jgi:hypothetical protein